MSLQRPLFLRAFPPPDPHHSPLPLVPPSLVLFGDQCMCHIILLSSSLPLCPPAIRTLFMASSLGISDSEQRPQRAFEATSGRTVTSARAGPPAEATEGSDTQASHSSECWSREPQATPSSLSLPPSAPAPTACCPPRVRTLDLSQL